jgi:hypothetical protein
VFGYRGNPTWRDMYESVVHFTKTSDDWLSIDYQGTNSTMQSLL